MDRAEKRRLSERDICTKFITPAIKKAAWDITTQVREELPFTDGRIKVRGKLHSREKIRRADYVLYHQKNLPIAVVEAKQNKHSIGHGMQQALAYAEALDVPFAFSSNGDGFLFHDRTGNAAQMETEISLDQFPSPDELWQRYCAWKGFTPATMPVVESPYYDDGPGRSPRYYQTIAVNRTVEAVAKGRDRLLLVMATGTGKTYTAFQIIWRLWKSGQKKRILFLADRNILVDQTKNNDFKPFGAAMTKISKRQINKSFEIYLSLYQAVTGSEEEKNIYKQFSPDFFDLIVIDECHRGSAKADSAWREILDYFSGATHIGMTATPKETKEVSNIDYFGEPIYTYSLRQGIDDGFLAPYKVIRVDFDVDLQGWRPKKGQKDKYGNLIEDRIYNQRDMDKNLVIEERTWLVAEKVTEFLQSTGEFQKTIVFCDNINHAERMRSALANLNPQRMAENRRYVMRITGDNEDGKAELDNFIDPESRYPVIAVTSKLMTTGVDAKTCKLVVLDQRIQSMTEFKQIIGRGTRIDKDYDKYWFTIMDFKKATELFADPEFDGDPVQIYDPSPTDPIAPDENEDGKDDDNGDSDSGDNGSGNSDGDGTDDGDGDEIKEPRIKYHVKGEQVSVIGERVQYLGADGKLITESMHDYTKGCVTKEYASMDDFLRRWSDADQKKVIIEELAEQGVFWDELQAEVSAKYGSELDPFDMICHIVFDQPPLTRRERAENVRKRNYFTKYGDEAKRVLDALLDKYADAGVENIEDINVLKLNPFTKLGTPMQIVNIFGGKQQYLTAVQELETALYG